jgi:DNA polymerase III delta subunit
MIIFLYGSDDYRRDKKTREIIEEYKKRHPNFVLQFFNLEEEEDFLKLQEFDLNRSFFEEIKMAVLENAFQADRKKLKEFLKNNLNKEAIVLVIPEKNLPTKEFEFLLTSPVQHQEFQSLNSSQLEFFIKKETQQRHINFTTRAIKFLIEIYLNDTWSLITELDKIALIGKTDLDISDLEKYIEYNLPYNIYDFINNLYGGNLNQSLFSLEKLFSYREEPAKIFNLLAGSRKKTKKLTKRLANYDILVKLGKLDYEEALVDLAITQQEKI